LLLPRSTSESGLGSGAQADLGEQVGLEDVLDEQHEVDRGHGRISALIDAASADFSIERKLAPSVGTNQLPQRI
jgi:hypothetical protein